MVRRWITGLAAFTVVCAAAAIGLEVWAALLFQEADEFNRTVAGAGEVAPDVAEYYGRIFNNSFLVQDAVGGLAAGALLGTLAVLVVLALRWERRQVLA